MRAKSDSVDNVATVQRPQYLSTFEFAPVISDAPGKHSPGAVRQRPRKWHSTNQIAESQITLASDEVLLCLKPGMVGPQNEKKS